MRSDPITGPAPEEAGRLAARLEKLASRATPRPWRRDRDAATDDEYLTGANGETLIKLDAKLMQEMANGLDTILAALRSAGAEAGGNRQTTPPAGATPEARMRERAAALCAAYAEANMREAIRLGKGTEQVKKNACWEAHHTANELAAAIRALPLTPGADNA